MEHAFVKQDGSGNFVKDNHVYMNAITKEYVIKMEFAFVNLDIEDNIVMKDMWYMVN